ncbi:unnamed protein product [Eruca vesicaria subsp. sativa]|uniref:S-protein homolog n=1 Tax=Eruca vesicaria subsp. sativa TaxID=29727 RepID=A0ABC8JTN0_ERUVS|nr:unnamed protein product [Eruca vesicaria subsp. sativa]
MDIPKRYLSFFILIIFVTTDLSHAKTVTIINVLDNTLHFHCKSKDYDLGDRSLQPGEMWSFYFEPGYNIFLENLYFCSFDLPNGRHWFDVYKGRRDGSLGPMVWKITPTGPCLYRESDGRAKEQLYCFPWNKN